MQPSPSCPLASACLARAVEQKWWHGAECAGDLRGARRRRQGLWRSGTSSAFTRVHERSARADGGSTCCRRERPCSLALLALHALATAAAVLQRSHGPPASGMQHALGQMCCVSERGGAYVVFMCWLTPCVEHEGGGGLIKPPPIQGVERASTTFVRSSARKITRRSSCDENWSAQLASPQPGHRS